MRSACFCLMTLAIVSCSEQAPLCDYDPEAFFATDGYSLEPAGSTEDIGENAIPAFARDNGYCLANTSRRYSKEYIVNSTIVVDDKYAVSIFGSSQRQRISVVIEQKMPSGTVDLNKLCGFLESLGELQKLESSSTASHEFTYDVTGDEETIQGTDLSLLSGRYCAVSGTN